MSSRELVLGRIRAALDGGPAAPPVSREYRLEGQLRSGSPALLDLLAERLTDYRAQVHRAGPNELPAVLADVLAGEGARRVRVPRGLPADWVPGAEVDRPDADAHELDSVDGVVTGCAVAIAETGTFVLDGGPESGRRALTLVPDLHVCVVRAEQVVHLVPEALRRLDAARPLTLVSGPSATSDIELDRVEGVHGPRRLHVVLLPAGAATPGTAG